MALGMTAAVDQAGARMVLNFTGLQAVAGASTFKAERIPPSNTVVTVRGLEAHSILGPTYVGYDYEAPIGIAVKYRVTVYNAAGTQLATFTMPATVTWATGDSYLKDVARPDRNLKVTVVSFEQVEWGEDLGVHRVLNRRTPVVISDVRSAAHGSLVLTTLTQADYRAMLAILGDGFPLLFQASADVYAIGNLYVQVGDVQERRAWRRGDDYARTWELDCYEVDSPVSATVGTTATYNQVIVAYATYQDVLAGETDYLDLLVTPGPTGATPAPLPPPIWRGG